MPERYSPDNLPPDADERVALSFEPNVAERSCLNCRWAVWRNPPRYEWGRCVAALPDLPALPKAVIVSSRVIDKTHPHADCPTWEAK